MVERVTFNPKVAGSSPAGSFFCTLQLGLVSHIFVNLIESPAHDLAEMRGNLECVRES